MAKLLDVDPEEWKEQLPRIGEHYAIFGDDLPERAGAPARGARAAAERLQLDDVPLAPLGSPRGER